LLSLATALTAASAGAAASASTDGHDQGIRIFSLRDASLGFAPNSNGQVVLAPLGADSAGKWNVTEVSRMGFEDAVHTNVATHTCLAAQSPTEGSRWSWRRATPATRCSSGRDGSTGWSM
jgi:hypothetical protein